jgi:hypothetical protein
MIGILVPLYQGVMDARRAEKRSLSLCDTLATNQVEKPKKFLAV